MLQKNRHRKLVTTALGALIVLGMWSNAMAAAFCPYMMGSSECCMMQKANAQAPSYGIESGTSVHDHMDHMQMSDMDMQDMPDMQMDDATSRLVPDPISSGSLEVTTTSQAEIVTQPYESCSYCMMHSPTGTNSPLGVTGQSSTSYQLIAANTNAKILKSVPSCLTFLALHDHGPPGSSAPLYVLVSAFRI